MAECKITFQDTPYTQEQFAKALKKGLLFNLLDRKVIDLPINIGDLGTSTKGFEQHFVSSKDDIKKSMMDLFQLPETEAKAVSEIYDRVAFAWASRHNSTREKFYNTITVFKGDQKALDKMKDVYNQAEPLVREALKTGYVKGENTGKVARERFDIPKLEYLGEGSDRDVYELGNGKVIKIAKTARGLRQNMYEGMEGYEESRLLPTVHERGLNYVVVERLDKLDKEKHAWLLGFINKANTLNNRLGALIKRGDTIEANKIADELESHLISRGFGMYTEADILYGDFSNPDNWGVGKDGSVMLSDAGTLAGRSLIEDYKGKSSLEDKEFYDIYERSGDAYEKYKDKDASLYYQNSGELNLNQTNQAAVQISKDGRAIIYALSNPNVSSPVHEIAHIWESQLRPNETQDILDWAGDDEWTKETSEKFARGFEKYLADGIAPTAPIKGLFEQFKEWLTNIYKGIIGSDIDLELNEPMKALYAKMLGENYKTEAEQALAAEAGAPLEAGQRDMRPDTMERRKNEYVEPVIVSKKELMERQMFLLNLPDKHLHPIAEDANDYYGWASQIQNAIRTGTYIDLIRSGELGEEQLLDILKSMRWSEDKEASDKFAQKNLDNILFKANEVGATYSIEGLINTKTDDPSFQSLSNYFIKSGKFESELNNGNISYDQAKEILDATISQDVETRDKLEKLTKQVDDKVGKEKKTKKVVKEKIAKEEVKKEEIVQEAQKEEVITPAPEETVADVTPEIITPEESNPVHDRVYDAADEISDLYRDAFLSDIDNSLREIAEQLNSSPSEAKTTRATFGDTISDIALEQYPQAKTETSNTTTTQAPVSTSQQNVTNETTQQSNNNTTGQQISTNEAYKVGDQVSTKGKNGIITEIDEDGFARIEDKNGDFVGYSNVNKLAAPVEEVEEVKNTDDRIPERLITDQTRKENQEKKDMLSRVAERIQKFLPSVNFEMDYFIGTWKGRIKDSVVQINLKNATLDTPIHEFMHPFVLSLRLQNYELYTNLLDELRYGAFAYNIDLVKDDPAYAHLTGQEQEEEALVRYLAEDIQTVFTERGHIDPEAISARQNSFLANVYKWFKELWDKIWNVAPSTAGAKNGTIDKMQRITYNKKTGALIGYKPNAPEGTRSFKIKDITDKEDLNKRNISDATVKEILELSQANDKDVIEIPISDLITVGAKKVADPNERVLIDVSQLGVDKDGVPFTIKLKDLADFIIGQEKIGIDLSAVQTAIDKLEAYQDDSKAEADKILKDVETRLKALADTPRRIVDTQVIGTQVSDIKKILRDYDGVEGVMEYLRQGMEGLNLAYRMVRYIQEDLDKDRAARIGSGGFSQGKLTQSDINGLNRDLAEVRSLLGFYNDIGDIYKLYGDNLDKDEVKAFQALFARAELRKKSIGGIATDLQARWLYPYMEEAQRNLPDNKKLTFEQFKRQFRFADQDVSSVSYWMGASINSRDPLTAILAVAVKDKLNQHHNEEVDKLNTLKTTFDKWLTRTGTPNRVGAIEKYYKDNYLRQAKVWETRYMDATATTKVGDKVNFDGVEGVVKEITDGKAKIDGYANRWAFHEEYYMDLYDDDLRKYRESLSQPITSEDWEKYNKQLADWVNANNPILTKGAKYRNPNFTKASNDEYFQVLYNTYKESNVKYGERQLLYGIVPQAYKAGTLLDKGKAIIKNAGNIAGAVTNKDNYTFDKMSQASVDALNYVFDEDEYMKAKDLNFDGSYYRGVKSPFTHLINQDNLDLRLNESVYGFHTAANTFSSLREVQANAENFKMLIEGNPYLRIEARKIAASDKTGRKVWDRFLGKPQSKENNDVRINEQTVQFINDVFYGEDTFQASVKIGKVNVSLNKMGKNLGFFTALTNMAGNVFAGISNVTIGNVMSFGEAVGGKYYGVKDWGKGLGMYMKSTPEFLADATRPVKSKITQLGILYDAIQGEFRDKYGKNITGNIIQRYASGDTFFIINHVAEHQIQLTGMLALMNATKVKLKDGKEVTLFDAYEKSAKGFYKIRPDAIWTNENENEFTRQLHGISKDLNGNYAAFDKGVIQRYWWGKLAIQYRKYLYPAWRSRFGGERVDYERGEVLTGYYRTFLSKLSDDIKDYKFNIFKLIGSQWNKKGWTKDEQYAHRKTMFDLGIVAGTTMIAAALAGMEANTGDDDKDKWARNALMLQMLRLRFDMSQFNISIIPEVMQQIKNPSASLNTLADWGQFIQQLGSPTAEYTQNSGANKAGDSKLGAKFAKILPLYRQYLRFLKPEQAVKYFNLINSNVRQTDTVKDLKEASK